ncbi:MAG TPA: PilZ domain-containing protein [Candidatus Acidoferrum sp.]|nr:PilZ domain-containing protein [Candidatus Acidoferrum sp.]
MASLGELPATLTKLPASGILLEVAASIKATQHDKEATHHLMELYPFAKFKLVGKEVMIFGKARSLGEFVHQCARFKPRTIRRETRETKHFAVYLSAEDTFEDAEQSVTINISQSGCFVYSIRQWSVGDRVWLRFLGNDFAICGTVFSWQPWGNNKLIPGIGIKLDVETVWP